MRYLERPNEFVMLYFTQLIYIHPGPEAVFDPFESVAIPIIAKYNGKLLLRVRPEASAVIEADMEAPYEIHLASFETEADFKNFAADEERARFLHLKEQAIRSVWLIKGEKL